MPRRRDMVGTYDYVADTRYSWGGIAFPFSGGSRAVGFQVGTFGFKDQPVYTVDQPDGTGSVYSVSQTFAGLTFAQNFSDRFSAGITAKGVFDNLGEASRQGLRGGLRHQLPRPAERPSDQVRLRARQPGHQPVATAARALQADVPPRRRSRARTATSRQLPQPAEFRTKDFPLPTIFRVGLAYDVITGDNNRLTVLCDFNQPNNNGAGFSRSAASGCPNSSAARTSGSRCGAATATPPPTTSTRSEPHRTALNDEETLQGLAFGGGLELRRGSGISVSASTTPGSISACSAGPISSASRSAGKPAQSMGRDQRPPSPGVADICLQCDGRSSRSLQSWRRRSSGRRRRNHPWCSARFVPTGRSSSGPK